ncbi:hypothetical protein JB92DRAFT_83927 [Gautieria morchelliformis]|nr:hypothetical protein JB92DRAFT_83927 [Gautieria morchelliformis]
MFKQSMSAASQKKLHSIGGTSSKWNDGVTAMKCPATPSLLDKCLGTRGCCSNHEIQDTAISLLCGTSYTDEVVWLAQCQYYLNVQIALCHFDGHSTDKVQLLLTPNASAILDSLKRPDEQLRQQQGIYIVLQIIGGHIGLPILLFFSVFPKKAQRDLPFLNLLFTWIISSISFSIALYRLGPASSTYIVLPFIPSEEVCRSQAALVIGAQVMTDTAMCALIIQLWLDIRAAIHGPLTPGQVRWTRATLLSASYVSLLVFSLPALGVTPVEVTQLSFYCFLSLSGRL